MSKLQQVSRVRQGFTRQGLVPSIQRAPKPPKFSRRVRRQDTTPAGLVIFKTKSFSNDESIYHPVVNLETYAVRCDCKGFYFHYEKHEPTVFDAEFHCCHLKRAIKNLRRRGELPLLAPACSHGPLEDHECSSMQSCALCGQIEARYEMCDDWGNIIPQRRICEDCVFDRADDLSDAIIEL